MDTRNANEISVVTVSSKVIGEVLGIGDRQVRNLANEGILIRTIVSTFLIGTLLQSLTYYTVNINYQKVTGTVRFSLKKLIKKLYFKIFKKDMTEKEQVSALSEVQRGPKKLTFVRAIITSIISVLLTFIICYVLFVIGTLLSNKVITMF